MNTSLQAWLDQAAMDPALMRDFERICSFGGRLAGSGEDSAALDWAIARLGEIHPGAVRIDVPFEGWECDHAELQLLPSDVGLRCRPLLRSASTPPEGLEAEVVHLGAGRQSDFQAAGDRIRGRVVLVDHEYPFSPTHLHRRRKYDMAVAGGAAGFLIANPLPGAGVLSGSSGRGRGKAGIPAAYIDRESAGQIVSAGANSRVRWTITGKEREGSLAGVGVLDVPGESEDRIVISAHIDGHDLGESALDNATGVACALAAARALSTHVGQGTHSLRICLFSGEEWALAGSRTYLERLDESELATLKLNLNLDTVAGDDKLTALISDFPRLAPFVASAACAAGVPLDCYLPLMPNSDHANFAARGIPALRLLAGFDRPDSRVNNILSAGDRRPVVAEKELRQALRATIALGWLGLKASAGELDALRIRLV
ncbi:M28 family peptidase [Ramlibacter sp.]|uniref:M28 family peptidase n=1 Tax=Ramlibacter sp. TaxID=1917967 RepID=UPI0026097DBD|nr:M28 family peptidase [Ramlibacter sp.]